MGVKFPPVAGGLEDVGAGTVGGPGKDCVVLMLGLRLVCDIAALSSLATTGFMASVLCSTCVGVARGFARTWSCCGCATLFTESRNMVASSWVQKYRSTVCIRYMYFCSLRGSSVGRCHWDRSC